jgi:putative FmdB family regulatory protein
MAIYDFRCDKCGHIGEYIISPSVKDEIPEKCPKCNDGNFVKQFPNSFAFDIVGSCYMNDYGKHAWKKGKTDSQISDYLVPDKATGKYKDPY